MLFHISSLLKQVPADLEIYQVPESEAELAPKAVRLRYAADIKNAWTEEDKIRAFRLMKGMRRYMEIDTIDKFSLRYLMSPVDSEVANEKPEGEELHGQHYHCLIGDSLSLDTCEAVSDAVGRDFLDAASIDAGQTATFAMTGCAFYGGLVSQPVMSSFTM